MAFAIIKGAAKLGRNLPLVVVGVGTDRSTGDSLGPLTGTLLSTCGFPGRLHGTLDFPVHAENLRSVHSQIAASDALVVAVDACLGSRREVGSIIVRPGPLKPGLGVGKKLPLVGDLHIAGVVNVGGYMEYTVLQSTRLSQVLKMAQIIAVGIYEADSIFRAARSPGDNPVPVDATHGAPKTGALRSLLPQGFSRQR